MGVMRELVYNNSGEIAAISIAEMGMFNYDIAIGYKKRFVEFPIQESQAPSCA